MFTKHLQNILHYIYLIVESSNLSFIKKYYMEYILYVLIYTFMIYILYTLHKQYGDKKRDIIDT